MFWLGVIAGIFIGVFIGILIMCILFVSKESQLWKKEK